MKDILKKGILSLQDYKYWGNLLEIKFKNVFIFGIKCEIAIENNIFNIPFFDNEIEKIITLYEFEMEQQGIYKSKIDLFNVIHTPNAKQWRQNIINYHLDNKLTIGLWNLELNILLLKTLEDIKQAMKKDAFMQINHKINEIKEVIQ